MEHREMSYRNIPNDSSTSLDRRNVYNGSQLSRLTSTPVNPGVKPTSNDFNPRGSGYQDRTQVYDDPPRSYLESNYSTDPVSEYFGSKKGGREVRELPIPKKRESLYSGLNKSSEKLRSPSQIDVDYHRLSSTRSPIGDLADNLGEVTIGTQAESRTSRRTNQSVITRNNISVVVDDGRDYVKCKKEVDGRAIWRYIRDTSPDLSPDDHKLLMFCIAELAKINKYRITSNMELRVYSSSLNGISPVFYSGTRRVKFVAIWHDYKDPEFIQINKSIWNYVPKYCLIFLSVLLVVVAIFTYLWFAVSKWHEFFIEMAHSFNATVNVFGQSSSALDFDDLDININMMASNGGKKK